MTSSALVRRSIERLSAIAGPVPARGVMGAGRCKRPSLAMAGSATGARRPLRLTLQVAFITLTMRKPNRIVYIIQIRGADKRREMVECSFRQLLVRPFALLAAMFILAGCSSLPRTPYTASDAAASTVLNLSELRRYADEPASRFLSTDVYPRAGPVSYLALSGGGADGAFGAGVLNGWSAAGTRPTFSAVSGVSTGALIAPFAFLGPAYDVTLREIYTSGVAESLLNTPSIVRAVFGSGLFGNTHLRELIARYVGRDMLAAIAAENAKGRKLLVVTTNIDTQRTVIWDMGRIAAIGSTQALDLFRDVLAASASIPVVFPPMLIDAEANGHRFTATPTRRSKTISDTRIRWPRGTKRRASLRTRWSTRLLRAL